MDLNTIAVFVGGVVFTVITGLATNLLTPVVVNRWRGFQTGAKQSRAADLKASVAHLLWAEKFPHRALASLVQMLGFNILSLLALMFLLEAAEGLVSSGVSSVIPRPGYAFDFVFDAFRAAVALMAVFVSSLLLPAAEVITGPRHRHRRLRIKAEKLGLDYDAMVKEELARLADLPPTYQKD